MSVSRRNFMRSGALTALSAGIMLKGGSLTFAQKLKQATRRLDLPVVPYEAQTDLLFIATQATFEPYIGSIFQARGARGGNVNLTLMSVKTYQPNPTTKITTGKTQQTDCFSLMFKASGPLPTFSSIPSLYHAALGKLDIFLVLHEGAAGKISYEAVINHI